MLGRAAARTVEGRRPTHCSPPSTAALARMMADNNPLFHASHGTVTIAAALTMAAIDADRIAMASQKMSAAMTSWTW